VARLYGTGLRLEECLELGAKDLDFDRHQIVAHLQVVNRDALNPNQSRGCNQRTPSSCSRQSCYHAPFRTLAG
jgi:hypothetical protein